jgi:hypothetical protein
MNEQSLVMACHVQIDKLIVELEQVCFDPIANEDATLRARIRRLQLIDVRNLLMGKTYVL